MAPKLGAKAKRQGSGEVPLWASTHARESVHLDRTDCRSGALAIRAVPSNTVREESRFGGFHAPVPTWLSMHPALLGPWREPRPMGRAGARSRRSVYGPIAHPFMRREAVDPLVVIRKASVESLRNRSPDHGLGQDGQDAFRLGVPG